MISVVFDMDGVLFDTQKVYTKTWLEVGEIMKMKDFKETAYACIGTNKADNMNIIKKKYGEDFPLDEFYKLKDEIYNRHIEEEGVPLMKGTKEILEFLRQAGAKIAIASSSRKDTVEYNLKVTGLEGYFDEVVAGNLVKHSKPDPEIYLVACEKLGVKPEETYAVEDSYNGIKSGAAAGMKVIMIPDMLEPLPEYDNMIYKIFDSLDDFRVFLGNT